jgi:Zinc finger, C3HC4 type (RING finger)
MSACKGDGTCIEQIDIDKYSNIACSYNCQLVECHNYKLCGRKLPQWVVNCHNGMCVDCAVMIGKIKFLHEKNECPICLANKDMIELTCKHKTCLECWINWSETKTNHPLTCPICRHPIWK